MKYTKQLLIGFLVLFFLSITFFSSAKSEFAMSLGKNINIPSPITRTTNTPTGEKNATTQLFKKRPIHKVTPVNFIAYGLQSTVAAGVPIESILLILSIPIISTIVIFLRYIIGVPTLGIAPTIVFAITFFATGLVFGSILFLTLLLATLLSRVIFRKIRIMQFAKVSLSFLLTSILILIALVISLHFHFISSGQISVFPILLFILLSERVVGLQLEKNIVDALGITFLTLIIGAAGFILISMDFMKNLLLVYPEVMILLIPINWFIGRYFGLRLTEYFRFNPNMHYGAK